VVNNAGISIMGSVEDTSIEEAKAQLETNFFGVLRVCRATLPVLRRQGGGHVVNISSLAGIIGLPFSGLYSASKFALEGVSESLRLECRAFGIRVVLNSSTAESECFGGGMISRKKEACLRVCGVKQITHPEAKPWMAVSV
jgi:short-subunit dehydrogenase